MNMRPGLPAVRILAFLLLLGAALPALAQEENMQGLDQMVPVFEVDNRPIKEVLNLLSRFSGLNFLTTAQVPDVPVTAKMSNVTVKQILDSLLPSYNLCHIKQAGEDFIRVMTQEECKALEEPEEFITRVFDLTYADVQKVAPIMTQLKSQGGTLFILPDQRRIIATDLVANIEEMARTLKELDVPTVRRVFRLKYINAEEAAQQLQGVLSPTAVIQIDPINNTLIIEDLPINVEEAATIIADLDRQRPLKIFEIQYADPAEIIDMIQALGILTDQATIDFHEGTNKILLQDIPARVELAQQVIAALDAPPLQVYIESRIMDVNLDRTREINPAYEYGKDVGLGSATEGLQIDSANFLLRFLDGRTRATDLTELFGTNFKVILDFLETDGVLRTIARPFGRVRNHMELYFQDGSEEPFLVRQRTYSTVGGTGDDIYTQRTRSVGRIISVIPHANSSGHVYMVVSIEDSNAQNVVLEGQTLLRVIEKTVETEVDVKTGHTVALGGLIFEQDDSSVSGWPIIKDIPIIGWPFRTERTERSRRKLVIFITPYVENLEDPFEEYETYIAPGEEDMSEFEDIDFEWGDDTVPVFESEQEGIFEVDDMDDLPEDVRESLEDAVPDDEVPTEEGEQDIFVP
jgi:type II secretory pathway component GspD/PulD (secretin)